MRNVLQTHRVLFRFRSDSKSNCAPWGVKCGTSFIQRYITDTQIWPDHKQILRISKQSHMRQLRHRSHIVYISHRSSHRFLLPPLACPRGRPASSLIRHRIYIPPPLSDLIFRRFPSLSQTVIGILGSCEKSLKTSNGEYT